MLKALICHFKLPANHYMIRRNNMVPYQTVFEYFIAFILALCITAFIILWSKEYISIFNYYLLSLDNPYWSQFDGFIANTSRMARVYDICYVFIAFWSFFHY